MRRSDQAPLMLQISGGDIITLPMELELLHGILASARTRAQHRTSGDPADMAAVFDMFEMEAATFDEGDYSSLLEAFTWQFVQQRPKMFKNL